MNAHRVHRATGALTLALSVGAALLVLTAAGMELIGGPTVRQPDEGAGARLFQLSIAALIPTGLLFLATADRERPSGAIRVVAASGIAVAIAFAVLLYFENR